MHRKPSSLLSVILAGSLSILISDAVAQDSLTSLEQALKDTGWSVQQNAEGSLILSFQESAAPTPDNTPSATDQWPQLQSKLQDAGWQVERETDGSLRLTPPETEVATKAQAVAPEPPVQNAEPDDKKTFQEIQQDLRNAGWEVTNSPDGSILLYPPEKPEMEKPEPCAGTPLTLNIALPVDTWSEAHNIARDWLGNQPPFGASVGKIRKILGVYLVSIVADAAPFNLIQQIAIRTSDGTVMVLN